MAAINYAASLKKVLVYEGGYSNDAGDPGGATMWGITHIDYDAYRKVKGWPLQDVRKMTVEERDEIYRKKYWDRPRCDELPAGVDFAVFDAAVNSGIAQAIKWLQRAVGVTADGAMGDVTMAAVLAHQQPALIVQSICDQRLAMLQNLKTWPRFGKGWGARVANVRRTGIEWARAAAVRIEPAPPPPVEIPALLTEPDVGGAKARTQDVAETTVTPETAGAATVGTTAGTGIVQQLQEMATAITPLSDTLEIVKYVLFGVSIIAAGYTIYAIWHRSKIKAVT